MKIGIFVLRAVVGLLFLGHGLQKLTERFGGHGLTQTAAGFEAMGLRPGRQNAIAAGVSEAAGGALLAAGLATPLATGLITGTMGSAVYHVHGPKGPWATQGGWEYNAVILAAAFAIADTGPGGLSLDHALGIERSGWRVALAQLVAGLVGSAAVAARATAPAPTVVPVAESGGT
ncbi:DoxX family protein [Pseudonocardia kujensis]|uniref:DoxX family protein n=1 Tax=Pseudonocardia kujensis TaxID=1128675 RepID=UPI001E5B6862|nr:DoxX family protein [Pseudonocardia kujensis]MCE0765426.1 DoxX family protein [Pseudonocardia kujensis]